MPGESNPLSSGEEKEDGLGRVGIKSTKKSKVKKNADTRAKKKERGMMLPKDAWCYTEMDSFWGECDDDVATLGC